eukprot:TRINITY_DN1555_c0_g1_i1.p6 TRINITY_DN1555_c0_g1~~TRINITY_DN1555_c0_g1_i1.p6  ORF type:complete len:113 (-),score=3.68 TRINITY_DN1555_c0_g1_i1:1094-1432(-)
MTSVSLSLSFCFVFFFFASPFLLYLFSRRKRLHRAHFLLVRAKKRRKQNKKKRRTRKTTLLKKNPKEKKATTLCPFAASPRDTTNPKKGMQVLSPTPPPSTCRLAPSPLFPH